MVGGVLFANSASSAVSNNLQKPAEVCYHNVGWACMVLGLRPVKRLELPGLDSRRPNLSANFLSATLFDFTMDAISS